MTQETLKRPFSLERMALLVRNRALEDFPALAIGFGIVAGLNLLSVILFGKAFMNEQSGQTWATVMGLSGLLLAGSSFKGMHRGRSGVDWILLPATTLEKYLAALASSLLLFPLAAATAGAGLSGLLSLAEVLAGGRGGRIWDPLVAPGFLGWANYAVGALIFAAGSASFRRRAFIKTAGMAVAYGLLSLLVFLGLTLLVRKARGLSVPAFALQNGGIRFADDLSFEANPAADLVFDIVRYALLPVFAFLYGYFRVAEKEAVDEVQ